MKHSEDNDNTETEIRLNRNTNTAHRKKQLLGAGAILILLVLVLVAIFARAPRPVLKPNAEVKKFGKVTDSITPQGEWLMNAEHDLKNLESNVQVADARRTKKDRDIEAQLQQLNIKTSDLVASVNLLEAENNRLKSMNLSLQTEVEAPIKVAAPPLPRLRTVFVAALATNVPKTPETYVPSGSTVNAVLLSGVDASVGVNSSSDPRPVLIRLTGKGSLPNGAYSHLKDCRLTGAAFGDISSSRAHIRLERLSCKQLGEFREFNVNGYVTGGDGKEGIRGRVVMQDGALMGRAFLGGFVGGVSKAAANGMTVQSFSPEGSVSTVKSANAFGYAGASGISDGLDSYAKYQIKRAEQYQPVIEVGSGTHIDVVFKDGFYLDGFKQGAPGTRQNKGADFNQLNSSINNQINPSDFLPQNNGANQ